MRKRSTNRKRTKRHSLTPILPTETMKFHRVKVVPTSDMSTTDIWDLYSEIRARGGSLYAKVCGISLEVYNSVDGLRMNIQYEARP